MKIKILVLSYQLTLGEFDIIQAAHTQIYFTVKYYLTDWAVFHFSAINLTDEVHSKYHGSSQYNKEYEQYVILWVRYYRCYILFKFLVALL
jgi:Holliday junction resolvase-like predicted endonuclease